MRSTSFLSNTSSIRHVENGMFNTCATFSASSVVLPHIASMRNPCRHKDLHNYCSPKKVVCIICEEVFILVDLITSLPRSLDKELLSV